MALTVGSFRRSLAAAFVLTLVGCQSGPSARHAAESGCGSDLPVTVQVRSGVASTLSTAGPPPWRISGSQVIGRWQTPGRSVEVRWPADPRELFSSRVPSADDLFIGGWNVEHADEVELLVQSPTDRVATASIDIRIVDLVAAQHLPEPCRLLQVRVATVDGRRETLGVRLTPMAPSGLPVEDLGPLIGRRVEAVRRLEPSQIQLCEGVVAEPRPITGAPAMPTAAEALREFLVSPAAKDIPRPTAWRPYDEVTVAGSDDVRYEHYVEWYRFVSIQVTRVGSNWSATQWLTGDCS